MKTQNQIRNVTITAACAALLCVAATPAGKRVTPIERCLSSSAVAYHDTWHKLWEDHITWTRMVIMGVLDNLPGTSQYAARLLQNPADMATALQSFYGAAAAQQFSSLVREHLLIAVDILNAAKTNNTAAFNEAVARWYQNAHQIAELMASLNPKFWPLSQTEQMWREHLDATLAEASAHLMGDFAAEVAAYDRVHMLALEMADFFSNGIIQQFLAQFR